MKNKWIFAGITGIALLFTMTLTACGGGGGGSDPKKVAEAYIAAAKKADWNGMKKYLDAEAVIVIDELDKQDAATKAQMAEFVKNGFADAVLTEVEINEDLGGNSAIMRYTIKGDAHKSITMTKVDGAWKVDYMVD
jgi:hypothetical protein